MCKYSCNAMLCYVIFSYRMRDQLCWFCAPLCWFRSTPSTILCPTLLIRDPTLLILGSTLLIRINKVGILFSFSLFSWQSWLTVQKVASVVQQNKQKMFVLLKFFNTISSWIALSWKALYNTFRSWWNYFQQ